MKRFIIRCCQAVFITSLVIAVAVAAVYGVSGKTLASTVSKTLGSKTTASSTDDTAKKASAKQTMISTIQATAANYPSVETSVSLIDLDSGEQTDVGESAAFTAASTTKVLTAAAYMHLVEEGKASLQTTISGSSAQNLLQRMLNVSDNTAWAALNDYIGKAALQTYADGLGLTSYVATTNVITAHDEAQIMAKLYKNELTTSQHTQLLFSYMHNTNNEDLIPAAMPTGATIYHKYGYLGGELHDAAVITYEGHHFVLVIYTKNSTGTLDDYTERTQLFHSITDDVLTYMTV